MRLSLPGARLALPGARLALPGARLALPGARLALPGARLALPGARLALPGARLALPGARLALPGARLALPGARLLLLTKEWRSSGYENTHTRTPHTHRETSASSAIAQQPSVRTSSVTSGMGGDARETSVSSSTAILRYSL